MLNAMATRMIGIKTTKDATRKVLTTTYMYRPLKYEAIDFLFLNEIVEYLIKILTVCLCEISV